VFIASRITDHGLVYAFEALPENLQRLIPSCFKYLLDKVQVVSISYHRCSKYGSFFQGHRVQRAKLKVRLVELFKC